MHKKKSSKKPASDPQVYVIYRGLASGNENTGAVRHIAPLVVLKTTVGTTPMMLRPGVTPVSKSMWDGYAEHPPIAKALAAGGLVGPNETAEKLLSRDQAELVDLVKLTQSPEGLAHILATEKARPNPRHRILQAIAKRAPRLRAAPPLGDSPLPGARPPASAVAQSKASPAPA